jgi:hypothetical protein
MPDYQAYPHFQHLCNVKGKSNSLLSADALSEVLVKTGLLTKTPQNIKTLSKIIQNFDEDGDDSWSFSEYLKMLYSSMSSVL